jgi:hypothetical protein
MVKMVRLGLLQGNLALAKRDLVNIFLKSSRNLETSRRSVNQGKELIIKTIPESLIHHSQEYDQNTDRIRVEL